jgi:probable HAF family extracellular repeat protein
MVHATIPCASTMGKGAARWWHALWLVWMVVERLTWLGTLGGNWSCGLGCFRRWLRGGRHGCERRRAGCVPFAGRRRVGCRTSARCRAAMRAEAHGVSADGSVVVGISGGRAFRWTAARGMQDLGTLGGYLSVAHGVSADGSVVVGEAQNAAGQRRAFRWTAARGMQDLGTLGGDWSEALAFPPMAPWWSAWLGTPHCSGVPFAGRRRVGCEASACCRAAVRAWL